MVPFKVGNITYNNWDDFLENRSISRYSIVTKRC